MGRYLREARGMERQKLEEAYERESVNNDFNRERVKELQGELNKKIYQIGVLKSTKEKQLRKEYLKFIYKFFIMR